MIQSIYQLNFTATSGGAVTTLLAVGNWMDKELEFPLQNNVETYFAIGAQYGKARAKGGARRSISYGRYQEHASHLAAATYLLAWPDSLPILVPGKIRVTIASSPLGDAPYVIYDLMDAVIISAIPIKSLEGDFTTCTTYRLEAGKTVYVSG